MREVSRKIITILIMLIMSFVCLYTGHFLLSEKKSDTVYKSPVNPVIYKHLSFEMNGLKQEGDMLEIDLSKGLAEIKPVLSYNTVFGYEKLSSIALRTKAYAAVNAGFFYEYGRPVGMVMIDGELISGSFGKYPVLTTSGNKAGLMELSTRLSIINKDKVIKVDGINTIGNSGNAIVYNKWYGSNNRAEGKNITATIIGGKVIKVEEKSGMSEIPSNGLLLTIYKPNQVNSINLKPGDEASFNYKPCLGKSTQCYQCGSWIIRNGKIVIEKKDRWIGVTTNNDPRTAVGVKSDGKLILFTVDGRQPGYSAGLTGNELGRFLLEQGVVNAAMLDGGASTEMIVKGEIVNRPSDNGEERPLGGGIIVRLSDN